MKYLYLLIVTLISFKLITGNDSTSPLCNKCVCTLKADDVNVDCSKAPYATVNDLYSNESFSITNGSVYDITYLNMTGLPIQTIRLVIPTSNLKVLDLTDTNIFDIINEAFKNLQDMVELKLGHNRLESLSPDLFKGLRVDGQDYPLKSLKILHLNDNNLHSIHNDAFQHIEQHLEELYLQGNEFKIIDMQTIQAIHGLLNLRVLDLSNTQISTISPNFLHTPAKLEEFYLSNNKITNVSTLQLDMAHVLKKLVLNGNPIVNITKETAFPAVPTLEILHLCNMPELTLIANHTMCLLTGLKELHMSDNRHLKTLGENVLIGVETGSEVPVIQNIKKLYIKNNALTNLDFVFVKWEQLEDLNINDNPWTCECENQWMVEELMPIYCKINKDLCKSLQCAAPIEMEKFRFEELYERKYKMRCLDMYGNHPENDGIILVCFMLGLLIGIVIILFGAYAWRRHWFGVFDKSPASYSRQFYGRTTTQDDFIE